MGRGKIGAIVGCGTAVVLSLSIAMLAKSLHKIEEGHVGIYFKHGALQVTSFA